MAKKDVMQFARKDFENLPYRKRWNEDIKRDSVVILPLRKTHDSGYRVMDFVAVKKMIPICKCSGYSDVLHIGGISTVLNNNAWSIDCLPKSGLIRIFCRGKDIEIGMALSSIEIFGVNKKKISV
ncbi:MAG: hypothetical protein FWF38_00430 [Spirochaetaceae bacterium]|nr:hypothetical protein [Spirochaetaceae bacterium]